MDERQTDDSSDGVAGPTEEMAQSGRQNSDGDETADGGFSRRDLLVGSGFLALGAGAGAYWLNDSDDPPSASEPDSEQTDADEDEDDNRLPFSVWEQMQTGLRESPDHLPGTADALVEEGEPQAIFEFVRDEIATQPPQKNGVGGFRSEINGGPRAALRSGMGTPREKVDLLADLLERAGYESEVVMYGRRIEEPRIRELFFGAIDRQFDPGFDQEQLTEWREKVVAAGSDDSSDGDETTTSGDDSDGDDGSDGGDSTDDEPRLVDPNGEESAALAERIRGALPAEAGSDTFNFDWKPRRSPVVRFRNPPETGTDESNGAEGTASQGETSTATETSNGTTNGWRYADLFHADETFGSLAEPEQVGGEPPTVSAPEVSVTLEAATTDAPKERMELVSGTWDATDLAGRQLFVETMPGLSQFDYPNIRYSDINRFVPALSVQDPHSSQDDLTSLSVQGEAFNLTGDRFTVADDGTVKRNGKVIREGQTPSSAVDIDPKATYLRTKDDDNAVDATPTALADHDVSPGDRVILRCEGSYDGIRKTQRDMLGVFSESATLTADDDRHRVPGAIDAGTDHVTRLTRNGNEPTDIPEDFRISTSGDDDRSAVILTIPEGATHLFVSPDTRLFGKNERGEDGYRLRITPLNDSARDTESAAPAPEEVEEVETLEVSANVGSHPQVRLAADALDGNDEQVQGLPGTAFAVTEDGEPVSAVIEKNEVDPRVIVAYDTSLSVDISGFYKDDREQFRERMAADIKELNPETSVEFKKVGSDVWLHMSEIATTDADLIIYLSDAHGYNTNAKTPARETAVEEGPPALMFSVTGESFDTATEIAELTDGKVIATNNEDEGREQLSDYVEELRPHITAYKLRYESPHGGEPGAERTVNVDLAGTDISATATYEIPGESMDPNSRRALSGLYLQVEVGDRVSRRTLAGWDPQLDSDREPNDADRNEAYSSLFGKHVLSFESAGVFPGVHLEEELAGKLTLETSVDAKDAEDHETVKEAAREGVGVIERPPNHFHPVLPDRRTEDTVTYSSGLRTVLYGRYPEFGTDQITHSIDILDTATTRTVTRDDDREREFRLTMDRTARRMIAERENLDRTTASLLSDATLRDVKTVKDDWSQEVKNRFETAKDRRPTTWRNHHIGSAEGDTAAFWDVEHNTGTVTGVLPDGSGGGDRVEEIKQTVKQVDRIVSKLGPLINSHSLGIVVSYYNTLVKLYGVATIAIETMDASGLNEQARKIIANFICNLLLDMGMEWAGDTLSGVITTASDVSGTMGGPTVGC
jgi:hypothetical protein